MIRRNLQELEINRDLNCLEIIIRPHTSGSGNTGIQVWWTKKERAVKLVIFQATLVPIKDTREGLRNPAKPNGITVFVMIHIDTFAEILRNLSGIIANMHKLLP